MVLIDAADVVAIGVAVGGGFGAASSGCSDAAALESLQ